MCKIIKKDIVTFVKKFFDKAIYAGIAFLFGCVAGSFLTLHYHPRVLTLLAFIVAAGSVIGKVLTKKL